MKECWFCKSSIDVENDKWISVGLLLFSNSEGADIDIHEDCLHAFRYTKGMMQNDKLEIDKCWLCRNSIPISNGAGWYPVDLCLPDSKASSVYMHSDCLEAMRISMEVMENTRVKKSQDTRDKLLR
jgi:hypothetical protein